MYIQLSRARACALFSCAALLLSACGGGGGGSGGNPPPPPPPPADTTAPDTTISATPASLTNSASASFTFTSNETNSTFESRVDGAAFAAATSPQALTSITDGSHTFEVRARDAAGNVDATPATASWTLDATPAQLGLLFPSRNFYTDATTVSVRGTAQDTHGVTAVSVNGVAAQSTDGFAHWSAVIPVPVGTTPLSISSTDGAGNAAAVPLATMMNRGPFVHFGHSVGFDAARNRVIVNDQGTGNIIAIRRSDGIGTLLSPGPAQGTTPGGSYEEMVIDAANDRALILNNPTGELIGVNLATGARTVVAPGGSTSSPTRIHGAFCLTLDAPNQRVYVGVGGTASVVRINLANGARTVVSSDAVGTRTSLANPHGIALDNLTNPSAPRLLVVV